MATDCGSKHLKLCAWICGLVVTISLAGVAYSSHIATEKMSALGAKVDLIADTVKVNSGRLSVLEQGMAANNEAHKAVFAELTDIKAEIKELRLAVDRRRISDATKTSAVKEN